MRLSVEEPGGKELLVVGLEQLARGLAACLARGRVQQQNPWISCRTSSRPVDRSVCTPGTASRPNGASTCRICSMFAASCLKSSSRTSDDDR